MGILDFISSIFKPAADLIDNLTTTDEERLTIEKQKLEIQKEMQQIEAAVRTKMIEYESQLQQAQAKIITAEATSSSWLTSNWRPITMLTFVALIVLRWLNLLPDAHISADVENQLMQIIKFGLGGYVVGRSLEKSVKSYSEGKRREAEQEAVG
jgi:hypothetical protein